MKNRYSLILAYITLFLWIWVGMEISESELKGPIQQAPWWGFLLTAALTYRLEAYRRKKKNEPELTIKKSKPHEANEA